MRHLSRGRKLGRNHSHRKAMLGNLAMSILDKERVVTTVAKAKEVRCVVERLISYGKRGGVNNIRLAGRTVLDKTILKKLFDDIGPSYKEREGGYTRILKLGERQGDNALMSIIELVGRERVAAPEAAAEKKPGKPKSGQTGDSSTASDAQAKSEAGGQ